MAMLSGIQLKPDWVDTEAGSVSETARFTAFRIGSGGREFDQAELRQPAPFAG